MTAKPYELLTRGGYPMDEVSSAMQKSIRRGLEEDALYWALELESNFPLYVWKRLGIICAEDIGLANPNAAILVDSLWAIYDRIKKSSASKSVDEDVLAFAVLYMCRSGKNREVDEFKNVVVEEAGKIGQLGQLGQRREIPDFALDVHTARGRQMGREIKHWWETGAVITREVGGSKYRRRARLLTTGDDMGVEDDPEKALDP